MKDKSRMRKWLLYDYTECSAMKEYLEDMALKGWILTGYDRGYIFEKGEPQEIIYSVEVFDKACDFDTLPEKDALEYVDYCSEAGWELVCNTGKLHIFKAKDKDAIPIITDEKQKYHTIVKSMLKTHCLDWFLLPLIFLFNLIVNISGFERFITSYLEMIISCCLTLAILYAIFQIIRFFIWMNRARKNLAKNHTLPYYNKKDIRNKRIIYYLFIMISVILIISAVLIDSLKNDYMILFLLLSFIIPAIISIAFFYRKKRSRKANILFTVFLGITLSNIVFIASVAFVITSSISNGNVVSDKTGFKTVSNEEIPLTFENFGITELKYTSTEKETDETIFAKITDYYGETFDTIDGDIKSINYSVFDSKYDWVINKYVKYKIKDSTYEPVQTDADYWGAKEVYKGSHETIIVFDDYVLSFDSDLIISSDKIDTIKTKLNIN